MKKFLNIFNAKVVKLSMTGGLENLKEGMNKMKMILVNFIKKGKRRGLFILDLIRERAGWMFWKEFRIFIKI